MKRLSMVLATLVLAGAGSAMANDAVVRTHDLEVKERLQHLELIEVTTEKQAAPDAEPLDAELQAILEDAEEAELARQ